MKKYVFSFLVYTMSSIALSQVLTAQEQAVTTANTISEVKNRQNVIKTNLLSPFSLGYERALGKHLSLSAFYLYLPGFSVGEPEAKTGYAQLEGGSNGYTLEARYYVSKTKPTLSGFFVGGYYLSRIFDVKVQKIFTEASTTYDIVALIPSDLKSYGGMFGWQKISKSGFEAGFTLGVGYYKFGNIPLVNTTNTQLKVLSDLSKRRSGLGGRLNVTLGYAF
jgi:hypothetical protein